MQEQESLIGEPAPRAPGRGDAGRQSREQFAAEAERAQATLTANENLRAAAQEADRAVARSERGFVEAREKIEVLEHDNQSLRKSANDQAQRIGDLISRQGELDRHLADAQRQVAELEAKLAAGHAERQKIEAQREAERAAAQTQAAAFAVKVDGLDARIAAADKILAQTRDQLRDKNEALLVSERALKETTIETQRFERRLESMQQDLDRRVGEVEELAKTRAELTERAEASARTVVAKNMAIESAEDKAAKLAERIDEITARFKQERSELEAANRKLMKDFAERTVGACARARRSRDFTREPGQNPEPAFRPAAEVPRRAQRRRTAPDRLCRGGSRKRSRGAEIFVGLNTLCVGPPGGTDWPQAPWNRFAPRQFH